MCDPIQSGMDKLWIISSYIHSNLSHTKSWQSQAIQQFTSTTINIQATYNMNVSNELIWGLTRDNSCYIVKRTNYKPFSNEPTNVMNLHRTKYSGLANSAIIGVQPSKDNKGVSLITKQPGTEQSPAKNYNRKDINSTSSRKVSKAIYDETLSKAYRYDIRYQVLARSSAIIRSQQARKIRKARS